MFTGFSQGAIDFLTDIRFNNNQQFYLENRERYETLVKEPMRQLCEEMAPVVQVIDPKLDTRPSRVMSRIRRDTRFSKDKSPFRDHAWMSWRYPGESRSEGFDMFWGFGPDWYSWGCGMYATDKPVMDALRLHIRREPDEVRALFNTPKIKGRYELYGESYTKLAVPDDVPDDLRALYVKNGFGIENVPALADFNELFSRAAADRLASELAAMAPLQQFMQRMRAQAEYAQRETVRERERRNLLEAQKAEAAQRAASVTARSADEFEF